VVLRAVCFGPVDVCVCECVCVYVFMYESEFNSKTISLSLSLPPSLTQFNPKLEIKKPTPDH
jgi:hypothetical protein